MPSADFCRFILPPRDGSSTRQTCRSPRVIHATFTLMPAAYTSTLSVQVWGFKGICLLTQCVRLICDSCSSGQCFAYSFLQILPRSRHPCRSANRSPCRAGRGLSPPSHPRTLMDVLDSASQALRAMPGAQRKRLPAINAESLLYQMLRLTGVRPAAATRLNQRFIKKYCKRKKRV